MALAGCHPGFVSDLPTGSDRARGSPHIKVVSEPRFRRF